MVRTHKSVEALTRQHNEQCVQRAFPLSHSQHSDAVDTLSNFEDCVSKLPASCRKSLRDSGIAGTTIHYRFSFDVATWLARKAPSSVSIDWAELDDYEALDDLLRQLLLPSEDEFFDSGNVSTQSWLAMASAGYSGTEFDWLMAQLQERRMQPVFRQLYDAADVPLIWTLGGSEFSKTFNSLSAGKPVIRTTGFRRRPAHIKKVISTPLTQITRLSTARGTEMIDVAIASLAVRHRETLHFNFANPEEVYVAQVGEGITVAVFGLLPEHRFPLECTMGYLILSNGVPIGYGGSSMVFKQANTGVNIFDEYRGTEAAYFWVQVMRVYHSLTNCTRYIANPYQFGADNDEALRSGAFWFYYQIGFRPVDPSVRQLAIREQAKRRRSPKYRCDFATLKRLASCDVHLTLPSARQHEFFDEDWLATGSKLATEKLGVVGGKTRKTSATRVVRGLMQNLGIRTLGEWTKNEQAGMSAVAPFIAVLSPSNWSAAEKRATSKLLRAKGAKFELPYARLMSENDKLLQELRGACKKDDSG